ncbi:WD40-repeat-containing domain protein [Trichoderma sp. SZMC 28014]
MPDPQIYTVGWICAITTELVAAQSFLDEEHEDAQSAATNDNNTYVRGKIGSHNVVIALLPHGEYGTASAAIVARDMLRSFPNVRVGLMVGIGGGAPSPKHDIRLGDVVVSSRSGDKGGVFQYDFGKTIQSQAFQETGFLNQSPTALRTAVGVLEAQYEKNGHNLEASIELALKGIKKRKKYSRPLPAIDVLYRSDFEHLSSVDNCSEGCGDDPSRVVAREERDEEDDYPAIHYGLIASANQVMKDAITRDKLAAEKGVLCFEMEAAGLMNHFPCIVIRGICDYSDSHKNKEWQGFAAMAAAAYAKDLLLRVAPGKVEEEQRAIDKLNIVHEDTQIIKNVMASLDTTTSLNQLSIAEGASFDSRAEEGNETCLPNTRVELLEKLSVWIAEPNSKPIFWLNGMAGTGKSTIARTLAQARAKLNDLGATFFFKRGESDRTNLKSFVSTLARQLARNISGLDIHIKAAIDIDSTIVDKRVQDQFRRLIIEPLSKLPKTQSSLVFVIDALDECEQDGDVALLIRLFSTAQNVSPRLRIFITSRPELPIRLGFKNIKGAYEDLILHEIPAPTIEHDITVFLWHKLGLIKKESDQFQDGRKLPQDWPGEATVQKLVMMAIPLFIFASTICRLIGDYRLGNPQSLLDEVLSQENSDGTSQLHMTYYPALKQQLASLQEYQIDKRIKIVKSFRLIVGTIVTLFQPLSAVSLSRLLNISEDFVADRLRLLHSVLDIPEDPERPIRLLHLSFRDYLINLQNMKEKDFWIDEGLVHQNLADHCLRIMCRDLREDICGFQQPGLYRSDIVADRIRGHVPVELEYACLYWVPHVTATSFESHTAEKVYSFLKQHLLHWTEGVPFLRRLQDWVQRAKEHFDQPLADFVTDAIRFLLFNFTIIDETPLQTYSSALLYTPKKSHVRIQFADRLPKWISLKPIVEDTWDPCLLILDGHNSDTISMVFSHDSKLLASASGDKTVRIWSTETGECRQVLLGHSSHVNSVAFSHDSKLLASTSDDKTVRIWSTETGECRQVLLGHHARANSVAFSHDSKLVASASPDGTARIWSTETGDCEQVLKCYLTGSVTFSHNSEWIAVVPRYVGNFQVWDIKTGERKLDLSEQDKYILFATLSEDFNLVALAYENDTVRICDTDTGKCKQILKGYGRDTQEMKFSHDSQLVAMTHLRDTTVVCIFNVNTGECNALEGDCSEVRSITFSYDSKLIAAGTKNGKICIWSTYTNEYKQVLERYNYWDLSAVFSHDSKLLASVSADASIRIWSTTSGECRVLEGHGDEVRSVALSQNFKLGASASSDKIVRIWSTDTGEYTALKGHSGAVHSVIFSHDSKLVASGSQDTTIRIWNTDTGECRVLKGHSNTIVSMDFSHDSKLVVSASHDRTVRIWNIDTSECKILKGHRHPVRSAVFSHNSMLVASGSNDSAVRIWCTETGECIHTLNGHSLPVESVVFSHSSKLVASAGEDNTVRIWNMDTGECLQKTDVHHKTGKLCFNANDTFLSTDGGTVPVDIPTTAVSPKAPSVIGSSTIAELTINQEISWVSWRETKILRLPRECSRKVNSYYEAVSVRGPVIIIGCSSGRVVLIRLCIKELDALTSQFS